MVEAEQRVALELFDDEIEAEDFKLMKEDEIIFSPIPGKGEKTWKAEELREVK